MGFILGIWTWKHLLVKVHLSASGAEFTSGASTPRRSTCGCSVSGPSGSKNSKLHELRRSHRLSRPLKLSPPLPTVGRWRLRCCEREADRDLQQLKLTSVGIRQSTSRSPPPPAYRVYKYNLQATAALNIKVEHWDPQLLLLRFP